MIKTQKADHTKKHHHDRAEKLAEPLGAAALGHKQADQNHHRDINNIGAEHRRHLIEPLNSGQNRNGRCDNGIAGKQRRAGNAQQKHPMRALAQGMLGQGHQRQCAPLALIVGLHEKSDIFQRDRENQRPDQQRDNADHLLRGSACIGGMGQRRLQRIKRAGADVPENNAHRPKRKAEQAGFFMRMGFRFRLILTRIRSFSRNRRGHRTVFHVESL